MTDITSSNGLGWLAMEAVECLLNRKPVVVVTHDAPYDRPRGWPLPIKRMPIGEPQSYRPLAILDYVEYALVEAERERLAAEKLGFELRPAPPEPDNDGALILPPANDWSDLI